MNKIEKYPQLFNHLTSLITDWEVEEFKDKILEAARPCLGLKSITEEDYESIGNCRFGGDPDLPKGWDYPVYENKNALFIAQLDLEYLNTIMETELPSKGFLYFFLLEDSTFPNIGKVLYYPGDSSDLKRAKADGSLKNIWDDQVKLKGSKVDFCSSYFLPYTLEHEGEDDELCDISGVRGVGSKIECEQTSLLGYPYLILGNPGESAYLHSNGLEDLDCYTYFNNEEYLDQHIKQSREQLERRISNKEEEINKLKHWKDQNMARFHVENWISNEKKEYEHLVSSRDKILDYINNREVHSKEMDKWNILFSIASFSESNMCWGDAGYLTFMIHDNDLENGDFSRIFTCTQA